MFLKLLEGCPACEADAAGRIDLLHESPGFGRLVRRTGEYDGNVRVALQQPPGEVHVAFGRPPQKRQQVAAVGVQKNQSGDFLCAKCTPEDVLHL